MQTVKPPSLRLDSIDIFRAVTMFLMIFVNDLWSLQDIPDWLGHSEGQADDMGFSDIIFPVFLFIVGLSIPFAVSNRIAKGDSLKTLLMHIGERTIALLVMGIYIVNFENISDELIINKYVWEILMVIGFFLIWNSYPVNPERRRFYQTLRLLGVQILVGLAAIYKGGDATHPAWMELHWYGILGLIGWSYLICAVAYVFCKNKLTAVIAVWVFLVLFNLADFAGMLGFLDGIREYVWIVGSGSMPAFTMAGVAASVIYMHYASVQKSNTFLVALLILGVICLAYGFGTRPFWGISKIRATPAWVGICSGISFTSYAFLFWLADVQKIKDWAKLLKPAGTSTLTCYLIPYIWYAVITIAGISLPMILRTGAVGLIKSLAFSLIVILLTGLINRIGVKLKI